MYKRWEKIAAYVNDHGGEDDETESDRKKRLRRPEDVIKMAREIQKSKIINNDNNNNHIKIMIYNNYINILFN